MAIGIEHDRFWTLNPRLIKPFIAAYKVKRKMEDERDWMLGGYFYEALGAALSGFGKKHVKYRDMPYMANLETFERPEIREMSDLEIMEKTDMLFDKLELMGKRFEASHKE